MLLPGKILMSDHRARNNRGIFALVLASITLADITLPKFMCPLLLSQ